MEFNFSDIININNNFDLFILKAITAREDLRKSTILMEYGQKEMGLMFFVFKIKVGFLNECRLLLGKLFSPEFQADLKKLPNYEKILELKNQIDENKNINNEVMNTMRNFTFHYNKMYDLDWLFKDKNFKDFKAEFEIGTNLREVTYQFTDEIYMQMLSKHYYGEFNSDISSEKISEMITEIADWGHLHMEILEAVIEGFLCNKLAN